MSLKIDLQEKISTNAARIMNGRLERCRAALEQQDAHKAIHDTRKQMKKIRAFGRLMRKEIGEKKYKMTNIYYRDISQKISEARDTAAMLNTMNLIAEDVSTDAQEKAFKDIKNHLVARKSAVSRRLKKEEVLEAIKSDLARAEKIHASWKIKHKGFSTFGGGLGKTYERCQKAMKKAYKKNTVESFHAWRKRAKYLRYQVAYLREVWHKPMKSLEKELHQLTDYLGDDHDLAVLKAHIEQMDYEDQEARTSLIFVIDHKRAAIQRLARPLGEKILLDSKKDFLKRLEFYWKKSLKEYRIQNEEKPLSKD